MVSVLRFILSSACSQICLSIKDLVNIVLKWRVMSVLVLQPVLTDSAFECVQAWSIYYVNWFHVFPACSMRKFCLTRLFVLGLSILQLWPWVVVAGSKVRKLVSIATLPGAWVLGQIGG